MAFFSKAGSILRQTVSKHINQELSASNPSLFQMIRCMSSSKLFIGGLSYSTDDTSLTEAFNKYGDVVEARVIVDRETGRSRGFGFVTFTSTEDASSAIQALDGQDLHGRRVKVNYANDRPRSPGFGGGGGYGGGGYGGGYGSGGGGYGGGYGAGGGGYGGGNYGGDGGYGSGQGNHGGDYGGSTYGSGGSSGGDSYASAGSSVSYGGEGQNFGSGGSAGGYVGSGGTNISYGSENQNFGVAGAVGGSDNYFNGGAVGGNSFASSGHHGNTGLEFSGGDASGSNQTSNLADSDEGYTQAVPMEGNYRDDDDEPDDYANRRA